MTNLTTSKRQKKGISTVLTTLIIVVASVVLGTAVTLFGTSLFQSGASQQSLVLSQHKLWNNGTTGDADDVMGAIIVRNAGDKPLAVDSITVRGVQVPTANWYYNTAEATTTNMQKALAYGNANPAAPCTGCINSKLSGTGPASWDIDRDSSTINELTDANGAETGDEALLKATGPISLDPGKGAIIYFFVPAGALTASDTGGSTTIKVFAGSIGQIVNDTVGKSAS